MLAETDIDTNPANPMLAAALEYAEHGLHVLPLWWIVDGHCACPAGKTCKQKHGKHPITTHGQHDATIDEAQIRQWFARWPNANLGLALEPSDAIAFDVDTPEAHATLADIEREHELRTARQRSGSGNLHVLAKKPAHPIRGEYRGITMRGNNYIVVAPSMHVSGGRYEWIAAPWDVPPIELPPALAEELKRKASTEQAKPSTAPIDNEVQVKRAKAWLPKAEPAIEGSHGSARLFVVCCKLVHGFKLGDSDALSVILSDYNPRCVPPWGDDELDEVRRKIHEARTKCDDPAKFAVEDRPFKKRSPRGEPDERDLHNENTVGDDNDRPIDDDRDAPHHAETGAPQDEVRARRERKRKPKAPIADDIGASDHPGRGPKGGYRMTDLGNALRFAETHRDRLRYVPTWGKWLAWDGRRWRRDDLGREHEAAKQVLAQLYAELAAASVRAGAAVGGLAAYDADNPPDGYVDALTEWIGKTAKRSGLENMIALARTEAGIVAAPDIWDRDPLALNVGNGTIDLRDGERRPHRQTDMITMLAPADYDPDAPAPTWERFLERVLPDDDVRGWVQRYLGYALTGDVREQCLAFFVGRGANGKNVCLDVVLGVLGDYGRQAPPDLVLASYGERHPTEIADIEGKRLVACSEIDQGRMWNEARIKSITGDATITARRMREDFHSFAATHKIVVAANTKPIVRGTDDGIWRRMRIVPWQVQIPPAERDKTLAARIIATEASGVLAWLVRGCLAWQRGGLGNAAAIESATADYRADQDVLGRWITERCEIDPATWCASSTLYTDYTSWCEDEGIERPWSRRAWHDRVTERPGISAVLRDHGRTRALLGITRRSAP